MGLRQRRHKHTDTGGEKEKLTTEKASPFFFHKEDRLQLLLLLFVGRLEEGCVSCAGMWLTYAGHGVQTPAC